MRRRSVKVYLSFIHPAQHVEYINEILEGGHQVRHCPDF